jgi:hypothetical protein
MAGMAISLTAVQEWLHDEELRKTVTEEVLSGKKCVQSYLIPMSCSNVAAGKCASLSPKHLLDPMLRVFARPQNSQRTDSTSSSLAQRSGSRTACSATTSSPLARRRRDFLSSWFLAVRLLRPNLSRRRIQRQLRLLISNSTKPRYRSRTCSVRKDKASKSSCRISTTYVMHLP